MSYPSRQDGNPYSAPLIGVEEVTTDDQRRRKAADADVPLRNTVLLTSLNTVSMTARDGDRNEDQILTDLTGRARADVAERGSSATEGARLGFKLVE
jgi:hypothetical protein